MSDKDRAERENGTDISQVLQVLQDGLRKIESGDNSAYAFYHLPANPFPYASIALAELAHEHPPLRSEQVKKIAEFLKSTLETGRFAGLIVAGDYGFGKTHLLRWLEHQINMVGHGRLLALYVQNPGTTPKEFVAKFTGAIGLEEVKKRVWAILLEILRTQYENDPGSFVEKLQPRGKLSPAQLAFNLSPRIAASTDAFVSRQSFLTTFQPNIDRLREFCLAELSRRVEHYDVARALLDIGISSESEAARVWSSITNVEGRAVHISYPDQFRAMLKLLRLTGAERIYLLFDEVEDITSARLSKRAQAEYQAVFRMLIDDNLDNFALVMAVTQNAIQEMKKIYPALEDRLSNVLPLLPLNAEDALELVRRYLAVARRQRNQVPDVPEIFPFTRDGVFAVLRVTRNPRAFLGLCHRFLAWGVEHRVPILDENAFAAFAE